MNKPLLIKNARIVDPASNFDAVGALLVESSKISERVEGEAPGVPEGAMVRDAKGMLLCPGLIDMRVFTGEPGHEYRETLSSAAKAAAAGGVTSFVCMPDTLPAIDDGSVVDFIIRRAQAEAIVNVLPAAAITKGLAGKEITEFGLLKKAGAACLTDGRQSIQSSAILRAAFTYAANFEMLVAHHVADAGLVGAGVMNSGLFATTLGLKGVPVEAETIPLTRDLQLARMTGVKYHAAQISCSRSVEILATEKPNNQNVSAGVCINNLALNELDVGQYRTFFKLSPPLRSEDDRLACIEGVRTGAIDIIHSGHDPQDVEVKRRPFAEAADGAIGLETLFAAALRLVHSGEVPLMSVLRAMTSRPADILGLNSGRLAKGAPADFMLADPDYPWVVTEHSILSRSGNTSFEGARFSGKVIATFVAGVSVFEHKDEVSAP
jgi:dihydroorotase